ncbi:hypothetical protein evm_007529 [Chilo suppressalis]|nr:hypothetical protein evm_007529 [Chilo suppressalis]
MRACLLVCLLVAVAASLAAPAPARSSLQLGPANNEADQQPFIEEVVVESLLHKFTELGISGGVQYECKI